LASPATEVPAGRLHRYRLSPRGTTTEQHPANTPFEWPRINYPGRNARPYRFAYGSGATATDTFALTKIDVEDGAVTQWADGHCYPGEPVFVPRPDGRTEDDGVVLSIVFDPESSGSFLLVLNGRDLSERARVGAPHRMPFGFHGDFFPTTPSGG
ncbi:MAG: carotenoid oxygenase family protein, partial [Pseudonocardia sp.]|nr:carotenoid oxygenase family protein [Pseudonocardia sp.]